MTGPSGTSIDTRWRAGPADPRLKDGCVHLWRADLAEAPEQLLGLLAADERIRAAQIVPRGRARSWQFARAVLRELLGRYLEVPGELVELALEPSGRPVLRGGALAFGVSHAGAGALYAFASGGSLGVDLEPVRAPGSIDEPALAGRAWGPQAAAELAALEPRARARRFARAWVAHEARAKCEGTGIWRDGPPAAGREPWLAELDAGPGLAAALAVAEPPRAVSLWDYRPPGSSLPSSRSSEESARPARESSPIVP